MISPILKTKPRDSDMPKTTQQMYGINAFHSYPASSHSTEGLDILAYLLWVKSERSQREVDRHQQTTLNPN